MANTVSIDALRPEIWKKKLLEDSIRDIAMVKWGLMGEDENSIIQIQSDLKKSKGDQITLGLGTRLSGNGVSGDDELEGNEEKINFYSEAVIIDQQRNGVRLKGRLDEQKAAYDARMEAKDKLSIWRREFIEQQLFLKLGGVTNTTLTNTSGGVVGALALWSNTPDYIADADEAAGTGARYICAASGGTDAITTADKMTPQLISRAKTKAMLANPKIQPIRVDGRDSYVMFVHPAQAYDLKYNAVFAQAMREAEVRGKSNPIFTGALGVWDNVIVYEHEMVPFLDVSVAGNSFRGAATGTDCLVDTARALLCGKQAAVWAEADSSEGWVEESFDYKNKVGFSTAVLGGVQKIMFNSKEYGVIAVDSAVTDFTA
jgi:N4-gp56 family major capsid protein